MTPAPPGTGLGLAVTAAITAAHGGTARAANTATGAAVTLLLPHQPGDVDRSGSGTTDALDR